jgi:two-component system chemotaxis response regulator CheB
MPKIRVMVVDDAVVIRRMVTEELTADPMIEVVGSAPNGVIALARMTQFNPDLVILDVEMPEMDGLATLKELRRRYPRLPIIMFSALTEQGAAETLDALALGATDYFTKPNSAGGLDASLQVIRNELVPVIKELCAHKCLPQVSKAPGPLDKSPAPAAIARGRIEVVAIASSTGGPNALAELFKEFPANFPVPILLVQHMPPMFTRLLAERLTAQSKIHVQEATSGAVPQKGGAWIAPGDFHMVVAPEGKQRRLLIHQDMPENSCRPAADPLFRSLAQVYGPNCLAVVLTGMGQDGLHGCKHIREAGGQILVQDEASSVVWGMPGYVARANLADRVLPLNMLAAEIMKRVGM